MRSLAPPTTNAAVAGGISPKCAENGALCSRYDHVIAAMDAVASVWPTATASGRLAAVIFRSTSGQVAHDSGRWRCARRRSSCCRSSTSLHREPRVSLGLFTARSERQRWVLVALPRPSRRGRGVDAREKNRWDVVALGARARRRARQHRRPRPVRLRGRLPRPAFRRVPPVHGVQRRRRRDHHRGRPAACPLAAFARQAGHPGETPAPESR